MFKYCKIVALALFVSNALGADSPAPPKENVFEARPLGVKLSIKMVGPYTEAADLQIICLFKHKPSGDVYQGAAKETDEHLGGILSAVRNREEFVGELGETFLFTPPKNSIPAKRFMVIGLGDEKDLSLDSLRVVGRIAAREDGHDFLAKVNRLLSMKEIEAAYEKIATQVHAQYSLGYESTNAAADGKWRKVDIKVRRAGLKVRTRKGLHRNSALRVSLLKPDRAISIAQ